MKKFKLFITILSYLCILSSFYACSTSQNRQNNNLPEQNADQYKKQIPAPTPTIVIPETQAPSASPTPPEQKEINEELGYYETDLLNKDPNRINNIKLAIKSIDGFVLEPGLTFSFNEVVGERTEEKGYKEANILVDGESSQGIGGGICQLSTTLYNAVEKAGLETTERNEHSKEVGYVPKGQDATVNYGTKDYKFINNKDYSIKINASMDDEKVYVSIEEE